MEIRQNSVSPALSVSTQEWVAGMLVTLLVAGLLGWGFVPGAKTLISPLIDKLGLLDSYGELLAFPLLAWIFSLSAAKSPPVLHPIDRGQIVRMSVIPFLVAVVYSAVTDRQPLFLQLSDPRAVPLFLWYAVGGPLGEELIFRKWLFSWAERWFGRATWPDTNPLPVAIWLSAFGFSLWHFQNASEGWGMVGFQVLYTFFAGIWLGTLRWMTGRVWPGVIGHMLINAVC